MFELVKRTMVYITMVVKLRLADMFRVALLAE